MKDVKRGHPELLALVVLVLVFLVALGSSRSLAHIGGPGNLARARSVSGALIILLVGFAVVPACAYVIWDALRRLDEADMPGDGASPRRRLLSQLLIFASVAATVVALGIASRHWHGKSGPLLGSPSAPAAGTGTTPGGSSATERTGAELAPWVLGGVLIALVLLLAIVLIRHSRRSSDVTEELPGGELETQRRELREAVESSLEEIESEPDPRRAVIRAYTGMESVLAKHGFNRRQSEAPLEYLARALGAVHLSGRACEQLTRLFERARFSEHAIGVEMKHEAIAALNEVRTELKTDLG